MSGLYFQSQLLKMTPPRTEISNTAIFNDGHLKRPHPKRALRGSCLRRSPLKKYVCAIFKGDHLIGCLLKYISIGSAWPHLRRRIKLFGPWFQSFSNVTPYGWMTHGT